MDLKSTYYEAWWNWHTATIEYHSELQRLIARPLESTQKLNDIRAKMDANYQVFLKQSEELVKMGTYRCNANEVQTQT